MKFLKDMFNKRRPDFEKGGKLEKFRSLFEANETFLFIPPHTTKDGAHIRDAIDSKRLMSMVIVALVPCLLFGIWNVGYQHYLALGELGSVGVCSTFLYGLSKVLPLIVVSYVAGGIVEVIFSVVRGHEINEGFLVTGLLIPLIMPASAPLWQVALSTVFGVAIGKEIFGGTGMNIFNPALTARAFMFFAFANRMSGDVWTSVDASKALDAYTGATPLSLAASAGTAPGHVVEAFNSVAVGDFSMLSCFLGTIPGSIGETSTLCILIGAVVLMATGVGSWRIMLSVFAGGFVTGLSMLLFGDLLGTETLIEKFGNSASVFTMPAPYHLITGGFAFGAVFMATDPVSAAGTNTGKLIYGFLIGATAVIVRTVNPAYPEGMMLSILFFNMFAPLIDHFVVQANIRRRQARAHA